MEQATMLKQMINFNKTIFNNAFNAMTMLQEQMGKMTNMSPMGQGIWMMPEGGGEFTDEYAKACRQGCRDFKNAVDENFKKAEEFFAGPVKEKKNATKNTTEKKPAPKNATEKENVTKK
ncbi:MAG: hypothetical protein J7K30_13415 [Deltaproteobacteria bacterium]|nr:hypothetical protein [Deltaproteobacteria bacterium]